MPEKTSSVRQFGRGALAAAWLGLVAPAVAVIVEGTDGMGNTNAPAGDLGWSHVSENGGGTGVYIGNSWVLTAAHVGPFLFFQSPTVYWAVAGSSRTLTNADGTASDLMVFQVSGDPGLPALSLLDAPPAVGAGVVAIGRGWERGAEAYWSTNGGSWVEVGSSDPQDHAGYLLDTSRRTMRWGTNLLTDNDAWIELDASGTISFNRSLIWSFDAGGTDSEGQAVPGDSGGGVFVADGFGGYALAGIMYARETFAGQPSASAAYGNESMAIDVSAYRDQIVSITGVPEPASAALVLLGAVAALGLRRRRRARTGIARVGAVALLAAAAAARADAPALEYLPQATSTVGDAADSFARLSDELPAHAMTVGAGYVECREVTKSLWDQVRWWAATNGYTDLPAGQGGAATNGPPDDPTHPVVQVSWYDAVKWCNARSEMEGVTPVYRAAPGGTEPYRTGALDLTAAHVAWSAAGYRLPTEAEWERAARGGRAGTWFPWGGTNGLASDWAPTGAARFASSGTAPAGSYAPNDLGLYDMAGNVAEWCWDWFDTGAYGLYPTNGWPADWTGPASAPMPALRVVRGGGWADPAEALRCGFRDGDEPGRRRDAQGFRVVRGFTGNERIDRDVDGMPDWWEYRHFGSSTGAVATADSDGDRLNDFEECAIERDPHDAASTFEIVRIAGVSASPDGPLVSWPSIADYSYDVLHSAAMSGTFTNLASGLAATPPLNVLTTRVEHASPAGYFRVIMRRPGE